MTLAHARELLSINENLVPVLDYNGLFWHTNNPQTSSKIWVYKIDCFCSLADSFCSWNVII